ncbi:MAG: hypothetical protein JW819_09030 [Candidatus Krumholzibacteriota bacterium]|nr:hypothetical protein [Candidatus Krumholzibacteriota bacterium]
MRRTTPAISDHDLRHLLSLLACDLSLTREALRRREAPPAELLPSLLARLADGLARAEALLAGRAAPPAAAAREDAADQLECLWERFRAAGRLPGCAELVLRRPWRFPAEPRCLHALLLNLLENACAAAPAGPLRVEALGEGLQVENGGAPLSEELAAALARGEAPAPRSGRGRGLGIILAAARDLGLDLAVERAAGMTRLRLSPAGGRRVLVVEDDADLLLMLAERLRAEGFRVEARVAAPDALPPPGAYLALVADLHLPGRRGDALLAAWKEADPALVTVLLTGDGRAADRDWPGVDAVVIKPGLGRLLAALAPVGEGA